MLSHRRIQSPKQKVPQKFKAALMLLLEAYAYAQDLQCDPWEFAVEIETLRDLGLMPNDFRWLVRKGLFLAGCDKRKTCSRPKTFPSCQGYSFNQRTCNKKALFILTESGLAMAQKILENPMPLKHEPHLPLMLFQNSEPCVLPHWDSELRELHVQDQIVKQYKFRAPNQEVILTAFEEEHWPRRIDDPLRQDPSQDQTPKRRLNDTVKAFNRF